MRSLVSEAVNYDAPYLHTPPSEVRHPPSKAAVTFLRSTAGNEKAAVVSSSRRTWPESEGEKGLASTNEAYAILVPYATLANLKHLLS